MIVTTKYIQALEVYYRFDFPKELIEKLFSQLGGEPYPMVYSDQDLWEQSRKIIQEYQENHLNN